MKYTRMFAVVMMLAVAIAGCSRVKEATLARGTGLFLDNKLELALPVLEASAKMCKANPDAHAWLAECRRRLGRYDDAAKAAYAALEIDPHHAFAHAVLGDLFAPHLSEWERADPDSAWYHLRQAVRYDPSEGGAWAALWLQAMSRGEREVERRAAVQMIDSGFLSKPVLAYNRWQLDHLPQDAILLTNGDMDTYPSVALQEKEGLREDVAVVNLSLLNLPWYARLMADRYGIPLPFAGDDLDHKFAYKDENGQLITVSRQIVEGWFEMLSDGRLGRPLCAAVTTAEGNLGTEAAGRSVLCGPYFEMSAQPVKENSDVARLAESIEGLELSAFEGSFTSPVDRSPVRRNLTDRIATNITAAMLRYADALLDAGRWDDAETVLARAEEFDSRILAGGAHATYMDSLRLRIDYHTVQ
jgi:tetratricopeptide (TPR) repeat protein